MLYNRNDVERMAIQTIVKVLNDHHYVHEILPYGYPGKDIRFWTPWDDENETIHSLECKGVTTEWPCHLTDTQIKEFEDSLVDDNGISLHLLAVVYYDGINISYLLYSADDVLTHLKGNNFPWHKHLDCDLWMDQIQ